jgi:hypothetical protein
MEPIASGASQQRSGKQASSQSQLKQQGYVSGPRSSGSEEASLWHTISSMVTPKP